MAFDFHKDRRAYFDQQTINAEAYVVPFVAEGMPLGEGTRVLEIGCAEGGVLRAFHRLGCTTVGVELSPYRAEHAREFLREEIASGRMEIICSDIFDVDFTGRFDSSTELTAPQAHRPRFDGYFDLIILKDVIEHIHGQEKLLRDMKRFLRPGGKIFFGFPPWQMPFGGHQQIARSPFLSRLPFYHLLPAPVYRAILKAFKEHPNTIKELMEIKQTGISLERFERIVRRTGYRIVKKQLYAINPIYQFKFGLRPRKQIPVIGNVPYLRNFINTAAYYLIVTV